MALMWPRELPNHVKADPRRDAERRVYEKLSKYLNDQWHVYYSRPWWGINSRGGEIDGEADFIIANEEKGIRKRRRYFVCAGYRQVANKR